MSFDGSITYLLNAIGFIFDVLFQIDLTVWLILLDTGLERCIEESIGVDVVLVLVSEIGAFVCGHLMGTGDGSVVILF